MCFSYGSVLIISFIFNFDTIIQSFLLGMTITGISTKFNKNLKDSNYNLFAQAFIIQLILTIIGLAFLKIYIL